MSGRLPTAVRDSSLTIFFGTIFVAAVVGQAFSGAALFNTEQVAAGLTPISVPDYVTSSAFGVDLMENWQSEYLQFLLFILATVW
ncbi:MAG: hypothetical protein JWP95_1088, partial [Actinotalea sp.]|nr:hypothetical protein [Actinotalea sp.]